MNLLYQPIYYEDEEEWYGKEVRDTKKNFIFGIVENESKKLIGIIGIHNVNWYHRNGELGYWLWKEYWNKGYMTEAVKLILKYAFEYLNLNKVWARVYEFNKASQRVLEKNGFKLVGKLRKQRYVPEEGYADEFYYDILKEEWKN